MFQDGTYQIADQELTRKFDPEQVVEIEKFNPDKIVTAIYLDNDKQQFNIKRFKIETTTLNNRFTFIKEGEGNYLEAVTTHPEPIVIDQIGPWHTGTYPEGQDPWICRGHGLESCR